MGGGGHLAAGAVGQVAGVAGDAGARVRVLLMDVLIVLTVWMLVKSSVFRLSRLLRLGLLWLIILWLIFFLPLPEIPWIVTIL